MLYWADPFDQYASTADMLDGVGAGAAWSEVDAELSTSNPATGAKHLRWTEGAAGRRIVRRVMGASATTVGVGFRFAFSALPTQDEATDEVFVLCCLSDASNNEQIAIIAGTDGSVIARRDVDMYTSVSGGTELGRSDPCFTAGDYHHFEIKAFASNSAGTIEVRINEVAVLTLTGQDTVASGTVSFNQILMGINCSDVGIADPVPGTVDIDDLYCWNTDTSDADNQVIDFVGDMGCYWRPVDTDLSNANWTPLSGSVVADMLDDLTSDEDTTYASTSTVGAEVVMTVEPPPSNLALVKALVPLIRGKKMATGAGTIQSGVLSGGDEARGDAVTPSTSYGYLRQYPVSINPDTGVAFTPSEAQAADLILTRTS